MRVLILRSNPIAPDPRVEKIARALTGSQHQVSCLGWDRTATLPTSEILDHIHLYRLSIPAKYGSGLQNLPALLRWQVRLLHWLINHREEIDVIHACDFDTILPALLAKIWYKKTVVYDIFDFYADHLRKTPQFLKKLIRRMDYSAIAKADAVILVDESRREQIAGSHPKRLEIIYNSPEDISPQLEPKLTGPLTPGTLKLAYVGLLQQERGLFEMLDVLARHPYWTLDLAGFGGDEEIIKKRAYELPNVTWYGRVSYEKAIELSQAADVLFATYDPSIPNHRYSSPNKVFEGMMLGKPLLVAAQTNMDTIIEQENCGLVIPYGNVEKLEEALLSLASDPELRISLGRNARLGYENHYSWEIMRQRLTNLYSLLDEEEHTQG